MASIDIWAADPKVVFLDEDATLSANDFYAGDLVKINTTGEINIAGLTNIHGIARKTATGTASTKIPVELIDPNGLYVVDYASGTATTETLIGGTVCINATTAGGQTWVASANTAQALIVALHPDDGAQSSTEGTYDAERRVIIRFTSSVIQATAA